MQIVEFLLARIAEDEAVALAAATIPSRVVPPPGAETYAPEASAGQWGWGGGPFRAIDDPVTSAVLGLSDSDATYYVTALEGWDEAEPSGARYDVATVPGDHDAAEHIARWDPARALAECEAKRLVIVWHQQYNPTGCGGDENHGREDECPTLRAIALPYAGHPDYNQNWSVQ